jgi:Cu(I)/Ag(I) efflux system membrane fusion protein
VKLRVNVANPDGRLKPEMFVRAIVHSKVAGGGMVMDENMAGKWICPMHSSVVKETS